MIQAIGQEGRLSDRVAEAVIRYIQENRLKEGDRLPNETELASALKVGRSTIREAMKQLASNNVITIVRGRGTFIADHIGQSSDPLGFRFAQNKKKLLLDLIELRLIVEPDIARLAAVRRTDSEAGRIQALQEEFESIIREHGKHTAVDVSFHVAIAEASHNSVISNIVPVLNQSVDLVISISGKSSLDRTIQYHRGICNAILQQNADEAESFMREHLTDHMNFILAVFGSGTEES